MRGDGPYVTWIIILAIALLIAILVARSNSQRANRENTNRIKARDEAHRKDLEISDLRKQHATTLSVKDSEQAKLIARMDGLQTIIEQRKIQFPWLATAFADFHALVAERDAKALETKSHPALKSAESVREYARKKRDAELNLKLMRYRVDYYEKLFPWIADYIGDDVPDDAVDVRGLQLEANDDAATLWLTKAEYERLPSVEKYQRALDNWRKSKKTRWQIGREYERYVGYVYETQGYDVLFTGAIQGFEDMGRDLIAKRGPELLVIQCKYWAQEKLIREKHIFQLFGSALEYAFRLGDLKSLSQQSLFQNPVQVTGVSPILYTSTKLSPVAKQAAESLQVKCFENVLISDYPMVKCNISGRDGEKIYHLPFDQQYDRTKIGHRPGEKYVYSVAEAERDGFRRAWKWRRDRDDA